MPTRVKDLVFSQRFRALAALVGGTVNASIKLADDNRWYVSLPGVSIVEKKLKFSVSLYGVSPEEAVDLAFARLTKVGTVVESSPGSRLRWAEFMWEQLP